MSRPPHCRAVGGRIATLVTAIALLACACAAAPSDGPPQVDAIRADELRADLYFLASDAMRGRRAASPEASIAAEFIKSRFERAGLEPAVDGSYFQPFDLATVSLGEDNSLELSGTDGPMRARLGRDMTPMPFSGSGHAAGEVVFAGFGVASPRLAHDDYGGADLDGKLVLILDHEPGERDPESPFDGTVSAEAARDWRKAIYAAERGAVGVLFVADVHNHPAATDLSQTHENRWLSARRGPRYALLQRLNAIDIPVARITPDVATHLIAGSGQTLLELAEGAEQVGGNGIIELPSAGAELTVSVERHPTPDRNVLGLLRGSDPQLVGEVVIVCAHLDHDGAFGDRILNGADDDGSGIVALLAIADAYGLAARAGQLPRRSILFAAWDAEEQGLLGAWAYTEAPIVSLDNTVAVLNMDMVGRNEEVPEDSGRRFFGLEAQTAESNANRVHIMGYSYSSLLREMAVAANEPIGLELRQDYDTNASGLVRRSDQWPFIQRGVPALFFHTGLHPDYHRETDTPDRIDYPKMERIARLVYGLSWDLANSDERPQQDGRHGTL